MVLWLKQNDQSYAFFGLQSLANAHQRFAELVHPRQRVHIITPAQVTRIDAPAGRSPYVVNSKARRSLC